jgi:hypothetical protein
LIQTSPQWVMAGIIELRRDAPRDLCVVVAMGKLRVQRPIWKSSARSVRDARRGQETACSESDSIGRTISNCTARPNVADYGFKLERHARALRAVFPPTTLPYMKADYPVSFGWRRSSARNSTNTDKSFRNKYSAPSGSRARHQGAEWRPNINRSAHSIEGIGEKPSIRRVWPRLRGSESQGGGVDPVEERRKALHLTRRLLLSRVKIRAASDKAVRTKILAAPERLDKTLDSNRAPATLAAPDANSTHSPASAAMTERSGPERYVRNAADALDQSCCHHIRARLPGRKKLRGREYDGLASSLSGLRSMLRDPPRC